ncbi:NAD(P)-dependent oxidoreductase [Patescibacteria group bacterium]|nr:NAD(P)-dependent oxidoreductase [Patescibacteria group bacterium]
MNILVLGAEGNLGTQIQKEFSPDNNIIALDKKELNLLDFFVVEKKLSTLSIDIIINCAAYNNVDKCEEDKETYNLALKLNAELPELLANIALKNKIKLVHYSSDYVFGKEDRSEPYLEYEVPNPVNNYGYSKYMGEKGLEKLEARGLDYYIIRTSKLFGPKGYSQESKISFFDIMLKLSEKEEKIKVVDDEISAFTYTRDLAMHTKDIISNNYPLGIYHLINKGQATWYQGALELFKILKKDVKIEASLASEFKRPADRPHYSVLANTKTKPLPYWKQALRNYLLD